MANFDINLDTPVGITCCEINGLWESSCKHPTALVVNLWLPGQLGH